MSLDSYKLAKYTIIFFLVEPFMSLILYRITGASFFASGFHATKDLLVVSIFFVSLLHFKINPKYSKNLLRDYFILVLLFFCIIINWFYSDASINYILLNSRKILIPFIMFLAFSSLIYKQQDIYKFKLFYYRITFIICVFGIIEFLLPLFFWDRVLGIPFYWNAADNINITSIHDVGRGYTSDLIFITGKKFKRMLSFFLEPTTLGTYLSLSYAYFLFAQQVKNRKVFLRLIFLSGFLCFSKIFLISIILVTILKRYKFKLSQMYFFFFFFFLLIGYFLYGKPKAHGAISHILGFYSGFEIACNNIFGLGLGMAGNRPELHYPGIMNGRYGGESGIGNIWAQIGFLGSLVIVFIYRLHKRFIGIYNDTKNSDYYALSVMLFVYYINLLLSASSLSLKANFILFIVIGVYISRKKKELRLLNEFEDEDR